MIQIETKLEVKQVLPEQRTTMDTNPSNRKNNIDSQQRTNFNTSMQNIPRGLINTAFSLNSAVSREEIPLLPLNPQKVLKYYISELTDYEKAEVLDFDTVYFLGKSKANKVDHKKKLEAKENEEVKENSVSSPSKNSNEKKEKVYNHNYGYDDDQGDYKVVVGDHIGYRYEICEFLGAGSFGTALRCIDHKTKK